MHWFWRWLKQPGQHEIIAQGIKRDRQMEEFRFMRDMAKEILISSVKGKAEVLMGVDFGPDVLAGAAIDLAEAYKKALFEWAKDEKEKLKP